MAKKYYAVKVGRTTGIFKTWDECKANVDGYPGALFKSFRTLSDAYAYMDFKEKQLNIFDLEKDNVSSSSKAIAYVDGSYNASTKVFSYGCVIFFDGEEFHLSNSFDSPELVSMRNVAGEIYGSMAAMEFAIKHNIQHLTIYHDYFGISKWCTGEWKANKPGTIAYKKFYDGASQKVDIKFEKVKGHSGDKYNDLADELAKKACGIC